MEGQSGFLVSKQWLSKVLPDDPSSKTVLEDLSLVGPVDNSDVIREVISDPCVGDDVEDKLQKYFVRLHEGVDLERVRIFPRGAWDLLMQWPGLKEGQLPIIRTAHNFSENEEAGYTSFELHPVVMAVHRLWSPPLTAPSLPTKDLRHVNHHQRGFLVAVRLSTRLYSRRRRRSATSTSIIGSRYGRSCRNLHSLMALAPHRQTHQVRITNLATQLRHSTIFS